MVPKTNRKKMAQASCTDMLMYMLNNNQILPERKRLLSEVQSLKIEIDILEDYLKANYGNDTPYISHPYDHVVYRDMDDPFFLDTTYCWKGVCDLQHLKDIHTFKLEYLLEKNKHLL